MAQPKSFVSHAELERARRLDAVNFARRSVRLEGFVLGSQVEAISKLYIDGKLSEEDFIAAIREAAGVVPR